MPSLTFALRPSHTGARRLQSLAVCGWARGSPFCLCCSGEGPAHSRREVILQSVNLALLGEASIGTDDAKTLVNSILGAPCPCTCEEKGATASFVQPADAACLHPPLTGWKPPAVQEHMDFHC